MPLGTRWILVILALALLGYGLAMPYWEPAKNGGCIAVELREYRILGGARFRRLQHSPDPQPWRGIDTLSAAPARATFRVAMPGGELLEIYIGCPQVLAQVAEQRKAAGSAPASVQACARRGVISGHLYYDRLR